MRFRWRKRDAVALVVLIACVVPAGSVVATAATTEPQDAPACATSKGTNALRTFTDVRVPSTRGTVWAVAQGRVPPEVGDTLKVVWRVTGSGPLRVTFTSPSGTSKALDFGPEPHLASTFRHPGDEWGTGFGFDAPGCWKIPRGVRRNPSDRAAPGFRLGGDEHDGVSCRSGDLAGRASTVTRRRQGSNLNR